MEFLIDYKAIAERMVSVRNAHQLKQHQVAPKLGLSRANYSRVEKAGLKPNLKQVAAFADYFKLDLNWLVFGKTQAKDQLKSKLIESLTEQIKDKQRIIDLYEGKDK